MKKKFKLADLDCANCAQKMEDAIKKIEGVENASVSFMMQKLTVEAAELPLIHISGRSAEWKYFCRARRESGMTMFCLHIKIENRSEDAGI